MGVCVISLAVATPAPFIFHYDTVVQSCILMSKDLKECMESYIGNVIVQCVYRHYFCISENIFHSKAKGTSRGIKGKTNLVEVSLDSQRHPTSVACISTASSLQVNLEIEDIDGKKSSNSGLGSCQDTHKLQSNECVFSKLQDKADHLMSI